MKKRDAISLAQACADHAARAFVVYRLTRRHQYQVRAAAAPGNDLLKIVATLRPRPPRIAEALSMKLS
jgi:hypothetical protein